MNSVILKEYSSAIDANLDRQALVENGIIAEVTNENVSSLFPYLGQIDSVKLLVMENDYLKAKKILGIE